MSEERDYDDSKAAPAVATKQMGAFLVLGSAVRTHC